jgi:hypothetical protein
MGSCGHVSSRQTINATASRVLGADGAYPLLKSTGRGNWLLRPISGWGGRRNEQTGGEILPTHVYCKEEKQRCGLLPGLVIFSLVAPPLQPGVVGPYPI